MFVSIHHNAFQGVWGTHTGTCVFYNEQKPKRDAGLAKLFADEMARLTGLRNRGALQDKAYLGYTLHMIRETKPAIPSALCEGGFMDSEIDHPVVTSDEGQRAYAQAVANVCIAYLGLQAEPRRPSVGDPIGGVLYSDVKAFVNGERIPSSNIAGNTFVCVEDLLNYGFTVVWDETARTLSVERNTRNPVIDPLDVEELPPNVKPGDVKCKYLFTDVRTYLSGELVKAFNIGGRTLIWFDLLGRYGNVSWDEETRELRLVF